MGVADQINDGMHGPARQRQVNPPLRRVLGMVLRNFRGRLGRSMVTLFGVILGQAFLVSVGASRILQKSLAAEEERRTTIITAAANIAAQLGTLQGRTLAVVLATQDAYDLDLLRKLAAEPGLQLRMFAHPSDNLPSGVHPTDSMEGSLQNADALLILNHGASQALPLPPPVAGVKEKMVMDLQGLYRPEDLEPLGLHYVDLGKSGLLLESGQAANPRQETARTIWIVAVSLIISAIGISNSLLMSVTERFREIGTLKCLGALDRMILKMFVLESGILGLFGSLLGVIVGMVFSLTAMAVTYGAGTMLSHVPLAGLLEFAALASVVGMAVAMVAAIHPALVAARMLPVEAMRSEV